MAYESQFELDTEVAEVGKICISQNSLQGEEPDYLWGWYGAEGAPVSPNHLLGRKC